MQKNTPNKVDHLLVEHVIAAVKKAESKEDALQKCINEVCTRLEWPIGHAYFPASLWHGLDPSKVRFCAKPDQYNVFRDITETTPCDIDADLPGRVLKTKKPAMDSRCYERYQFSLGQKVLKTLGSKLLLLSL